MNEQKNEVGKKLNGPDADADERVSRSEQGLLVDEVLSLHSVDSSADDNAFEEYQSASTIDRLAPEQQESCKSAKNGLFWSGRVSTIHDVSDDIQDLGEEETKLIPPEDDDLPLNDDLLEKLQELQEKVALLEKTKEDAPGETLLPEDSYSFLAVTKPHTSWSRPGLSFLVAFGIFVFQIITLILLAVDVVDKANEGNHLGIPGGVDIQVRISQLIALVITVISQDEVRMSLNVLYNGYDEQIITREFGAASQHRWYFSSICRLVEGCLALAVTFMLVITVDSVRELLLNFTAVEFVSNVDNTVFLLSKWGYFGKKLKKDAETVAQAEMEEMEKKRGRKFPRTACLILIFLGMLAAWLAVSFQQMNGEYLPKSIYVQFGDEFLATLGTFSGVYKISRPSERILSGKRAEYVLESTSDDYKHSARFRYCAGNRIWVFLYGEHYDQILDVCSNKNKGRIQDEDESKVHAVSSETFTYDISDTASDSWFVRDKYRDVPLQHFSLHEEDSGQRREKGVWMCPNHTFGASCQFSAPCTVLEINERYNSFADSRSWSPRYNISYNDDEDTIITQVYGRPIYFGNETQMDSEQEQVRDLIFFTGRRWALTHTNLFEQYEGVEDRAEKVIADFKSGRFHAHWTNYSIVFLSEPVDIDTPVDGATPVALRWFRAKPRVREIMKSHPFQEPDFNRAEEAVFLCAICNPNSNPCVNNNECTPGGKCLCTDGSRGRLCQITPEGDGRCNPDFNTAGYGYDGGDCCPQTCVPGEHTCGTGGKDSSMWLKLSPRKFIGFTDCKDPNQLCDASSSCWKPLVDLLGSRDNSQAGTNVKVSGNGAVVAVYETGTNLVRVFEQDGSKWKPRGEPLKGGVAYYESDSNIAISDIGSIVALATNNSVQVFRWEETRQAWSSLAPAGYFSFPEVPLSVALSSDGTVMAIALSSIDSLENGYEDEMTHHHVLIFQYSPGIGWSPRRFPIILNSPSAQFGLSVSLSSDGSILATGHSINGTVGVYEYNSELNQWISFGPPLPQGGHDGIAYNVSLSGDGKALAVGNSKNSVANVYVYNRYNDTFSNWTQRGMPIIGEPSSALGTSISISDDATILAVGVPFYDHSTVGSSHVELYYYNESHSSWIQYGTNLSVANNDRSGVSVSLSRDGNILTFGAPTYDKEFSGMVRVMWNAKYLEEKVPDSRSQSVAMAKAIKESVDMVSITFQIQLDMSPWDTRLDLDCDDGTIGTIPFDELMEPNKRVLGELLIPRGTSCTFTIADFEGDGICCSISREEGFYRIYYGNEMDDTCLLAQGGQLFGSDEQVTFTAEPPNSCEQVTDVTKTPMSLSLSPLTIAMELRSEPGEIDIHLTCGDMFEMNAPLGTFRKSLSGRHATFLFPNGIECTILVNGLSDKSGYLSIYHGNDTEEANVLGHNFENGIVYSFVPGCNYCTVEISGCPAGLSLVQVKLATDENGEDISMSLWDEGSCSMILEQGFAARSSNSTFMKNICVPDYIACLRFRLHNTTYSQNSNSSETCYQGVGTSFQILLDGEMVKNGTGICDEGFYIGNCTQTCGGCPVGEKSIAVDIATDWYPQDTIWGVWDVLDEDLTIGTARMSGGPYRSADHRATWIFNSTCVPEDACLLFVIQDLSGNGLCCKFGHGGYTVFYGWEPIATGGEFESCDVIPIGQNCPTLPTLPPTLCNLPETAAKESLPPTLESSSCPDGTTSLRFELLTDRNPQDISWKAEFINGTIVMNNAEPYDEFTDAFQTYVYETCVADDLCIQFSLLDLSGNGICCDYGNGSYSLYFGDELLETGGESYAIVEISSPACMSVSTPTLQPNQSPSSECSDGFELLRVNLFTDQFPAETSFYVTDNMNGLTWIRGGPYEAESDVFELFNYESCVPIDRCFTFTISDSAGDGICCQRGEGYYTLSYGDVFIQSRQENFGYEETRLLCGGTDRLADGSTSISATPSSVPSMVPSLRAG